LSFILVGRDLAHYRLTQPLGSGAMSEVYLAKDKQLQRDVAVKVILDSVARKPALVERFEREARAAGRLDHPNVARVYFFGQTDDGAPFYAMELVAGWSLGDIIEARARLRIDQVLSMLAQCSAGLQAALDAGIVHRDIKPANLMIGQDGVVKIVDFGLAKLSDDKSLTRSGTMLGTPYYMAPEIVRGDGGDWRADIYSLGVTFFQLLIGYPPYEADTPYGVMMKHINDPVPDIARENPKLPPALCALITSMLDKDPNARPKSWRAIQAAAMGLASELGDKDLLQRLAWCAHETRNTVDSGGRCASCNRLFGGTERPARFHVDLVGWNRNGAEEAVATYIGKAVGNPASVIAPLLKKLPFRAAYRSPRERAKRMQRTFFEMGADVELIPADDAGGSVGTAELKELPFRPYWPPEVEDRSETASSSRNTRPLRSRKTTPGAPTPQGRTSLTTGVLAALCGILAIALVIQRTTGDDSEPTPTPEPATEAAAETPAPDPSPGEETPAEEATEDATASAWNGSFGEPPTDAPEAETPEEATPEVEEAAPDLSSARFTVTAGPGLDLSTVRGALTVLEEQAGDVDGTLGLATVVVPLEFTDAAHVGDGGARSWPAAPFAPTLQYPLGGVRGPKDPSLIPAARLLYGRAALHRASGGACPPWLLVGLSLVIEQGGRPPSAVADLVTGDLIDPSQLDVTVGANPPRTERLLHSYGSWLVTEKGWDKVGKLLSLLQRNRGDIELAYVQAFGQSPTESMEVWFAAIAGE